jgi:hypothetical protein
MGMSRTIGDSRYYDEIPEASNTLRCSCGTAFARVGATGPPVRAVWSGDGGLYAQMAARSEASPRGTVRARCPGCGFVQNFEQSGNPVEF